MEIICQAFFLEPFGGIEPRTILPTLRTGLEDRGRGKGQYKQFYADHPSKFGGP
jgi:hypothetical protein